MADPGSVAPRLDMQQLFIDAQHRWLRPAEICEILRNYQNFQISVEPPNRPPSGSLFIFDRKVLRYFRKDGHNWRKKKDGKIVREAHEKLKVGSVDVIHCYYAHGEDNENFQRRSYWMLEQELTHIVFVHYLEVKGNRTSSSPLSSFSADHINEPSGITDSTSPTSTLSSLYEDSDSVDSHQKNSMNRSYGSPQILNGPAMGNSKDGLWRSAQFSNSQSSSVPGTPPCTPADTPGNNSHVTTESGSIGTWQEVFEQCSAGYDVLPSHISINSNHSVSLSSEGSTTMYLGGDDAKVNSDNIQSNWQFQIPAERGSLHSDGLVHPSLDPDLAYDWNSRLFEQRAQDPSLQNILESFYSVPDQQTQPLGLENFHMQLASTESQQPTKSNFDDSLFEGNDKHIYVMKQSLLSAEEGLKKVDSFSRWVSKELLEVDDLNMRSSSTIAWNTEECVNVIDDSSLSPSLSQDQLFSIIDFSPKWSYLDSETEVHIFGSFLKSHEETVKCDWSCMFGEVEVPAEVLTDGVLCCRCPHHAAGMVPFYVTNSNRLACSEVREFDYRPGPEDVNISDIRCSEIEFHLLLRLERLLSIRSSCSSNSPFDGAAEKRKIIERILSLKEEGENYQMTEAASGEIFSSFALGQMKEKLFSWLLHKVAENGKGPSIFDDDGQGVLHLAAALGLNWAIEPIVTAGVSINFRDVNGWTALHWAAFYGREETVCALVSHGAATGALTDPSPEFPLGRPPADLASQKGHKGISGFLAESSLTNFLKDLTVKEPQEDGVLDVSGTKTVQTIEERTATSVTCNAAQEELSLKDSLSAMRNATQAASRIYQVFRMQSFQRKKLTESEDEFNISDENVLSLLPSKTGKSGNVAGFVNAAAIKIQKKYRGWKKRKEFLVIRERIVKIQAHVRGHQVRKQYKPITWSVGIVEKIILRWRRKGSGLRGFRRDALAKEQGTQALPPPVEDAYDVLKEGRKQNEERMQQALTRVKSMIGHPEGRAQYRRLLTVVEGIRESKGSDMVINTPEGVADGDEDLFDFDSLLDDDTFMSLAFENP